MRHAWERGDAVLLAISLLLGVPLGLSMLASGQQGLGGGLTFGALLVAGGAAWRREQRRSSMGSGPSPRGDSPAMGDERASHVPEWQAMAALQQVAQRRVEALEHHLRGESVLQLQREADRLEQQVRTAPTAEVRKGVQAELAALQRRRAAVEQAHHALELLRSEARTVAHELRHLALTARQSAQEGDSVIPEVRRLRQRLEARLDAVAEVAALEQPRV